MHIFMIDNFIIDSPLEPHTMNYTFLSNSYVKLEWSPVDTASYYLVALYLPEKNESTHQIFQTNDTSLIILRHEGMIVTVHSVNECNMKSSNYTHRTINKSEASKSACKTTYSLNHSITHIAIAKMHACVNKLKIEGWGYK